MFDQKRSHSEDDHVHDSGQRRFGIVPRCAEEYRNGRPGSEKARVLVFDVGSRKPSPLDFCLTFVR